MLHLSSKIRLGPGERPVSHRPLALALPLALSAATFAFGVEPVRSDGFDTPPSMHVEVERTLVIEGGTGDSPRQLSVSPKRFDSWESLFVHLGRTLGAKLIHDETGKLIGASGTYSRSGKVVFEEDGKRFDSRDYVASYLGGRSGTVRVGDEQVALKTDNTTPDDLQYLRVTDCDGESCVAGETWVTHEPLS